MLLLFFLSSGLFLGWSLGANDASNVFGTAVATRMVKFRTAAYICSVFVILGAVISGAGASHTLGKLGAVNAIAGAFMVALAAAVTVYWMTRLGLPVSTSQAIVGAIIGWNFFSGVTTDYHSLVKIVSTWVVCPFLAAGFSIILYKITKIFLNVIKIHLLRMDAYTRLGLLVVGAFGSYSLGANNIANVMGVFVPVAPFKTLSFMGIIHFSSAQQLFLLGAIAISVGVFTYSYKVMATVGNQLVKLTPVTALIVVLSQSLVLFVFASEGLSNWLTSMGLPAIPLVPVSSSQAVVGAVLGIGIIKGGKGIKFRTLGEIAAGWITTPIVAAIISFIALFFLQNVFSMRVYRPVTYVLSNNVCEKLEADGISTSNLTVIKGKEFKNAREFLQALKSHTKLTDKATEKFLYYAEVDKFNLTPERIKTLNTKFLTKCQYQSIKALQGRSFSHKWQFHDALTEICQEWRFLPGAKKQNKKLQAQLDYLYSVFRITEQ